MKQLVVFAISMCSIITATAQISFKNNKKKKTTAVVADAVPKYPFELIGEMDGYTGSKIIIADFFNQTIADTIPVVNGKFIYKGMLAETQASIYIREDGQNNNFFLDTGKHNMIIDCKENKGFGLTTSPSQESMNAFNTQINPYIENRKKYNTTADSGGIFQAKNEADIQTIFKSYLAAPTTPPIVANFLVLNTIMAMKGAPESAVMEYFSLLPPAAANSGLGKRTTKFINKTFADEVGKIAPDFTLMDVNGKPVKLSSYKGKKYVLVDFWATWCGPCRKEFPELMAAQTKYKDKDLVILGVSIDANKESWEAFVKDQTKTNWQHVWDGPSGPDMVANTLYSVPSIPRNFLIDKDGKVIARNLRGAGVESTLAQYLK